MLQQSVGSSLNENRTPTSSDAFQRLLEYRIHSERIVAINTMSFQSVSCSETGNGTIWLANIEMCVNRVQIVFTDKHNRQPM
jgi:hypothetical protein